MRFWYSFAWAFTLWTETMIYQLMFLRSWQISFTNERKQLPWTVPINHEITLNLGFPNINTWNVIFSDLNWWLIRCRSSCQRCFVRKGVLRNFAKFTEKHLCQSLFFNKVAGLSIERFLWFLRNFWEHVFYRTPLGDCFFKWLNLNQ